VTSAGGLTFQQGLYSLNCYIYWYSSLRFFQKWEISNYVSLLIFLLKEVNPTNIHLFSLYRTPTIRTNKKKAEIGNLQPFHQNYSVFRYCSHTTSNSLFSISVISTSGNRKLPASIPIFESAYFTTVGFGCLNNACITGNND